MSGLRILISGGGIAGPTAAFFLSQYGADVTIIERASTVRTSGQNIDIRGAAIEVVRTMGLEADIRAHHTTEAGMVWVDSNNKTIAPFPSTSEASSFTAEIEILRTDLARILYDATKTKARWIFGNHITGLQHTNGQVQVTMASGDTQSYDIVIAADGLGSSTRSLAIPAFNEQWIKRTGMYMAFFSIPKSETDSNWCRWYMALKQRSVLVRPERQGNARIVLCCMNGDPRLEQALGQSVESQKALMHDTFRDIGWESERILAGMNASTDFYMDKVAQIRMPYWSQGRVVLLGDAGFGPSPITGMGTTISLISAYVLAGEIGKSAHHPEHAFAEYEKLLRPLVSKAQKIPPGAPGFIHPESSFGRAVTQRLLSFASVPWVRNIGMKFSGSPSEDIILPTYTLGSP